jgi:hypothetical protein
LVVINIEPVPNMHSDTQKQDAFWVEVESAISKIKNRAPSCRIGLYGVPYMEVNGLEATREYLWDRSDPAWGWYAANFEDLKDKAGRVRDAMQHEADHRIAMGRFQNIDVLCPSIYSHGSYEDHLWIPAGCAWAVECGLQLGKSVMPFVWGRRINPATGEFEEMSQGDLMSYAHAIRPYLNGFEDVICWHESEDFESEITEMAASNQMDALRTYLGG